MTADEIKAAYAALSPEERSRCMQDLNNNPEYSRGLRRDLVASDGSRETEPVLDDTPYQLGSVILSPPGPSWYERLARVHSPYIECVGATDADGDEVDVVEYLMEHLSDTDIRVALYVLALGADAVKPLSLARRRGQDEVEALAEIDTAADQWYGDTGAGIQEGSELIPLLMNDHPYPSVVASSQKKTQ